MLVIKWAKRRLKTNEVISNVRRRRKVTWMVSFADGWAARCIRCLPEPKVTRTLKSNEGLVARATPRCLRRTSILRVACWFSAARWGGASTSPLSNKLKMSRIIAPITLNLCVLRWRCDIWGKIRCLQVGQLRSCSIHIVKQVSWKRWLQGSLRQFHRGSQHIAHVSSSENRSSLILSTPAYKW